MASVCADMQGGFWDYHDELFEDARAYNNADDYVTLAEQLGLDGAAFRTCLDSEEALNVVVADYNDGRSYGITGTPTFFVNGIRIIGAQPFAAFRAVIDEELGN